MLSYLLSIFFLWVGTAIQFTWPVWLRVFDQPPHLLLALVACTGLVRGAVDGCLAGLVAGVLLAGAAQLPMGGLLLGFMVVGAGAGLLRGTLFSERVMVAILVSSVGVVIWEILRVILQPPAVWATWFSGMLGSIILTALVAPLAFWLMRLTKPREPLYIP